jgi:uncharacterized surface protein with fasciclin (FAS1) repeats
MKKWTSLLLAFAMVMFVACDEESSSSSSSSDGGGEETCEISGSNVAEIIEGTDELEDLTLALNYIADNGGTDFLATLADEDSTYTVFAPNNEAFVSAYANFGAETFAEFSAGLETAVGTATTVSTLSGIVLLHVAAADVDLGEAEDGDTVTTLYATAASTAANADLTLAIGDDAIDVETTAGLLGTDGEVVNEDVCEASNGKVHEIDTVLLSAEHEAALGPLL